jgi:hypothetical protein
MRARITEGGVRRCTTKLTGTRLSRLVAWEEVRGKPSRMKDAEGSIEWDWVGVEEGEGEEGADEAGWSQPLLFISSEMRLRIMESGTRFPDCIAASAFKPDLVRDCSNGLLVQILTEWCSSAHILSQQITRAD